MQYLPKQPMLLEKKGRSNHKANMCPMPLGGRGVVIAVPISTLSPTYTSFQSEPIQSEPLQSEPLQSEPIQSEPIQSEPIQSEPLQSEPLQSEPIQSEPLQSEPIQSEPLQSEPPEGMQLPRSGPNTKWANRREGCEEVRVRAHSAPDRYGDPNGRWKTTYYMEVDGEWLQLETWKRDRPFGHRELRELRKAVFAYWRDHFNASKRVQFKLVAVYPGDYANGGFLRKWSPKQQAAYKARPMNGSKKFIPKQQIVHMVDVPKPAIDHTATRKILDAIATIARLAKY